MTAGELIGRVDALRPNRFSAQEKRNWLRRIDGQVLRELHDTHPEAQWPELEDSYQDDTELLAPFPYGEEMYLGYLFCQIDLHNGEIQKYNQSLRLLSGAWRQLADWINRSSLPGGAGDWKF